MADIFSEVLDKIYDGLTITFTAKKMAEGDHFLLFGYYKKQKVTFHTNSVPYWIDFDGGSPMRLEDCPESFYRSILKNIPNK